MGHISHRGMWQRGADHVGVTGWQVVTNKAVGAVFIEKTVDPAVQFRDDMHKIRDDPL